VPCGFTSEGLPVGLQIVGRHQDELGVLQLAYAFEQATGYWQHRPSVVVCRFGEVYSSQENFHYFPVFFV